MVQTALLITCNSANLFFPSHGFFYAYTLGCNINHMCILDSAISENSFVTLTYSILSYLLSVQQSMGRLCLSGIYAFQIQLLDKLAMYILYLNFPFCDIFSALKRSVHVCNFCSLEHTRCSTVSFVMHLGCKEPII